MPLKKERITIDAEGRDRGKVFEITEMPALPLEEFAYRCLLALARNGADVPDLGAGMAGLAVFGIRSLVHLRFDDAKPLLAEMLACIKIAPDSRNPSIIRDLVASDIEEISTLFTLRMRWFELHTGFSIPDSPSTSTSTTASLDSSTPTKISRGHARPSSRPEKPLMQS